MMNIVLIGYRGTGKSAVAKIVADKTDRTAISLDSEIEKEAALTIPQIVSKHGWDYFRDLEQSITERFSKEDSLVLDTGGGVILRDENIMAIQQNSVVVWLTATPETIESRIASSTNRPALKEGKTFLEEIEEVLEERLPRYKKAMNFKIETDHLSPQQIADSIIKLV